MTMVVSLILAALLITFVNFQSFLIGFNLETYEGVCVRILRACSFYEAVMLPIADVIYMFVGKFQSTALTVINS